MAPISSSSAHILVIDSNVTLLGKLTEALRVRFEQFSIVSCSSSIDALRHLESNQFNAVFSNIHMPDMTILKFLATVQKWHPHLPVLLFVPHAHYRLVPDAIAAGAYDIIREPIDWEHLETSLSSAVHACKVAELRQQLIQQEAKTSTPQLLQGLKVLVVDDDIPSKDFQTMALESCGAEVTTATSVEMALKLLHQAEHDVLVSDIRMPSQDGYSLIRQLRRWSNQSASGIPAIAVTAYANEEERGYSLKAGFQLQVPKPVDPDTLVLMVASLTGRLPASLAESEDDPESISLDGSSDQRDSHLGR